MLDEIERAEAALRALRSQVVEERQHRTQQLADGTAGGRPRPDANKLVHEAEELAVAAQAQLIAFADRTLALILERLPQWQAQLARRDSHSRERVRQAEQALREAQEEAGRTNLARRWSERQANTQVSLHHRFDPGPP